jgi:Ca-activated chloride channel family protein
MPESASPSETPGALPLVDAHVAVAAHGGLARVELTQRFRNTHAEPLSVTYKLPLPADAAVAGFRFEIAGRVVHGQVDKRHVAKERFEEALAQGRTAGLLEEERTSLFTQRIGNVPPGVDVVVHVLLDQPLRFLSEGQWEWRFPLAAAPRYLGAEGRVRDSGRVEIATQHAGVPARASLALDVHDLLPAGRSPESPSHPLQHAPSARAHRVTFGSGGHVPLDRDVVVRWEVVGAAPGLTAQVSPPVAGDVDSYALLTVVPPAAGHMAAVPRDLTILLDTSGSMSGSPIDQAKRISLALLAGLTDNDQFELIEFSHRPRAFATTPLFATPSNKAKAQQWLQELTAGGGTEMKDGILAALTPLRPDSQKQVILVTDGLIGFESEIVSALLRHLPARTRLHTVGVGSSINRSLTEPAARAARGIEVILGLGEDAERAAERLRARTLAPLVTEITASGDALLELSSERICDLYAGAPVLLSARVRAQGGEIVLRGRTHDGVWEQRVRIPASRAQDGGPAVRALFGREAIAELEMRLAAGAPAHVIDARIEDLGVKHQIASRLTSWVAIDTEVSVDPTKPTRSVEVPHELPYGMSAEGLGLRLPMPAMPIQAMFYGAPGAAGGAPTGRPMPPSPAAPAPARAAGHPPPPRASRQQAPVIPTFHDQGEDESDDAEQTLAPEQESKKSEGFVGRLRAAFGRPQPEAPSQAKAQIKSPTVLPGRVVLRKDTELILEITVATALAWGPGQPVLHFGGGMVVRGNIDWTRSTAPGQIAQGMVIRVTITFAPNAHARGAALAQVVFDLGQGVVLVSIAEP